MLRNAQFRSLVSLLNFNDPNFSHMGPSKSTGEEEGATGLPKAPPVWKVLVMDQTSTDILSTSLRVQDLRENGVTLHLYVPPLTQAIAFRAPGASRRAGRVLCLAHERKHCADRQGCRRAPV